MPVLSLRKDPFARAQRALAKGQHGEALTHLEQALARRPDDVKALRSRADTLCQAGRFEEGTLAHVRLAEVFAGNGLMLKAIAACRAALDLDPEHEGAGALLRRMHAEKGASALAAPPAAEEVLEADDVAEVDDGAEDSGEVLEADDVAEVVDDDEVNLDVEAEDVVVGQSAGVDLAGAALPRVPLFSDLPRHAFEELVRGLVLWRVPAGAAVLEQGEAGTSCFVLVSGRVRVVRDGEPLATLGEGEFFGEMALLSLARRSASVYAEVDSELLELDRKTTLALAERSPSAARALKRFARERALAHLFRSPLFAGLDEELLRAMVKAFRTTTAPMGRVLVRQGKRSRGLSVVLSGEVDVSAEDGERTSTVKQLHAGDVFGEMGLLFGEPAAATVTALLPTTLLTLSRGAFEGFCRRHPSLAARLEDVGRARREENEARLEARLG